MSEQLEQPVEFNRSMHEQIQHAVKAYNTTSLEMKNAGTHIGALITASLTNCIQLLTASGFDGGKTAEEVKKALHDSVGMMEGFVDNLFEEFESIRAKGQE